METIIISGLVALCSNVVTWFLAKKKYNVEVDASEIDNLRKSMDLYKQIIDDINIKLNSYIKISESYRLEVYRLRGMVYKLIDKACLDGTCSDRKLLTNTEVEEILEGSNSK